MKLLVFTFFCLVSRLYGVEEHREWVGEDMCRPTSADVLGPYYFPDPPFRRQICDHDPQFPTLPHLLIEGRILNEDCIALRGARVEVWQANHDGNYLFRANCRGYFHSGKGGHFAFLTIHPGKYAIDEAGRELRPAHVHFRVAIPGYKILVTQMYFAGDSDLGRNDACTACSSNKTELIVQPEEMCPDDSGRFCFDMVHFDLVLKRGDGVDVVLDIDDTEAELIDAVIAGK